MDGRKDGRMDEGKEGQKGRKERRKKRSRERGNLRI